MTTHNEHSPQHEEVQKQHALEQSEVLQVLNFLKQYGKLIGAGILAAIIMVLISTSYTQYKTKRLATAEQLMSTAKTPQDIEEIVKRYSSTPTAPVALLGLAKTSFNNGNIEQSREYYNQFIKKYKRHEMRPIADLGLAYCTEAAGDFGAAAQQFQALLDAHPDHYLQAPTTLGLASSLAQAQQSDKARIILEDFLAENINTPWAGPAEIALQQLDEK